MDYGIISAIGDLRPKTTASEGINTVLLLPFDGPDASTYAKDMSFSNKAVTFVGTAQIDTAQYKFGGSSLLLDGNSDYVSLVDSTDWDLVKNGVDFTIELWVKHTDHAGTEGYVIFEDATTNYSWNIMHQHGSGILWYVLEASSAIVVAQGGEITDTNWHHVAVTKLGNRYDVWLDGVSVANTTDTSEMSEYAATLQIGRWGQANYFDGWIDDVRIIKGKALYTSDFPVPTVASHASGNTRYVGPNCQYTTIQAAITASLAGDTILVAPGTYTEAITYSVDNLTIKAIGSYFDTTIAGSNSSVVSFGGYGGCVLEGFTISQINAAATSAITGGSDNASDYNYINDCLLYQTGASNYVAILYSTDGNWELRNVQFVASSTSSTTGEPLCAYFRGDGHTFNLYSCKFTVTNACTESGRAQRTILIYNNGSSATCNMWNCDMNVSSTMITTSYMQGILTYTTGDVANLYNCSIAVSCSSTGLVYALHSNAGTINAYNCSIKASTGDGDGNAIRVESGTTINAYGCTILDGSILNAGTFNNYNTNNAGAANIVVNNASLILNFNGLDGAVACYDESGNNSAVTFVGNAQIDTAQYKFAPSSILFDGNADEITLVDSTLWHIDAADYTVATWVRFNSLDNSGVNNTYNIISQYADTNNKWGLGISNPSVGVYKIQIQMYTDPTGTSSGAQTITGGLTTGVWYHFAAIRLGNIVRVFVNGIQCGTDTTVSGNISDISALLKIGSDFGGANLYLDGWVDSTVIVKRCLYTTTSFQPPSLPYNKGGYGVVSSGTTGGTGSAATGKNYINVVINGTTRKLFYDTTF